MVRNKKRDGRSRKREVLENFRGFLHGRRLRMTDDREAIVLAALERTDHFRVEDLVEDIQQKGAEVSAATVYRALPLLVESGIIEPTEVSGDKRSYEVSFGREHHDHLICARCGKVVEFQFEAFAMLEREVALKYGFELTAHFHELIGICRDCRGRREWADA